MDVFGCCKLKMKRCSNNGRALRTHPCFAGMPQVSLQCAAFVAFSCLLGVYVGAVNLLYESPWRYLIDSLPLAADVVMLSCRHVVIFSYDQAITCLHSYLVVFVGYHSVILPCSHLSNVTWRVELGSYSNII